MKSKIMPKQTAKARYRLTAWNSEQEVFSVLYQRQKDAMKVLQALSQSPMISEALLQNEPSCKTFKYVRYTR